MSVGDVPRILAFRSFHRHFLTIGAIVLMCTVWFAFFLWAVFLTQYTLSLLDAAAAFATPGTWQYSIKHKLETGVGPYLPAICLLLTSLLIFFYRVPRVRGPLTIPLEFAVTTVLFIVINLATLFGVHIVALAAPAANAQPGAPSSGLSMASVELGAAITIGMLALLFWLQGAGALRRYWRRLQRPRPAQPQSDHPTPARSAHPVQ
jgi:hypothetical protein